MLEYVVSIASHPLVFAGGVAVGALVPGVKLWLAARQVEALAHTPASKV
jgi:hypothetical protein